MLISCDAPALPLHPPSALFQVHALLISHLRNEMPMLWGKDSKKEKLIETLLDQFKSVLVRLRPALSPSFVWSRPGPICLYI